jgi:hypothetical protein
MIDLREDHTCGMAAQTLLRPDKRERQEFKKESTEEEEKRERERGGGDVQRRHRGWPARTAG